MILDLYGAAKLDGDKVGVSHLQNGDDTIFLEMTNPNNV